MIYNMTYIPEVHLGTREQIIKGLIEEASSISMHGFMRMSAQDREINRIHIQLKSMGVDFLVGTKEDDGHFLVVENHLDSCTLNKPNGECNCPTLYRVEGRINI